MENSVNCHDENARFLAWVEGKYMTSDYALAIDFSEYMNRFGDGLAAEWKKRHPTQPDCISNVNPCADCQRYKHHELPPCEYESSKLRTPVPGWDATLVPWGNGKRTWKIWHCPKYIEPPIERRAKKPIPAPPKEKERRLCLVCGNEFVVSRQRHLYCSKECRKTAANENYRRRYLEAAKKKAEKQWAGGAE